MRVPPPEIVLEDSVDFLQTAQLLDQAFPKGYTRGADYLAWVYKQTDVIPAVIVAAQSAQRKVGQMVLLPHRFAYGPRDLTLGQSIDFFMAPEHRTGTAVIRLSRSALATCRMRGLDGVYGAPNASAFAVAKRFLRGDQELALSASLGIIWPHTGPRIELSAFVDERDDAELSRCISEYQLRPRIGRIWTASRLASRLRSPVTRFAVHGSNEALAISCLNVVRGVRFTTLCGFFGKTDHVIPAAAVSDLVAAACDLHGCAKYCYVGVNEALKHAPGITVPEPWRPSPLRFLATIFPPEITDYKPSRFELIDLDIV